MLNLKLVATVSASNANTARPEETVTLDMLIESPAEFCTYTSISDVSNMRASCIVHVVAPTLQETELVSAILLGPPIKSLPSAITFMRIIVPPFYRI